MTLAEIEYLLQEEINNILIGKWVCWKFGGREEESVAKVTSVTIVSPPRVDGVLVWEMCVDSPYSTTPYDTLHLTTSNVEALAGAGEYSCRGDEIRVLSDEEVEEYRQKQGIKIFNRWYKECVANIKMSKENESLRKYIDVLLEKKLVEVNDSSSVGEINFLMPGAECVLIFERYPYAIPLKEETARELCEGKQVSLCFDNNVVLIKAIDKEDEV